MSSRVRSSLLDTASRAALALCIALGAASAHAQYKVIGPDGKVTYTDREPTAAEGKVVPIGSRASAQAAEPDLPFELRQASSKYPVTLYVTTSACDPCTSARQLLKQRGVPYSERLVVTVEDSEALERLSGAREAPTLTIGSQTLRGFAADVWGSYLDAAGYPRESRLPAGYQNRPAAPIVDRRESAPRPDAPAAAAPAEPARPSGGIRF